MEIPESLKRADNSERNFHPQIADHPKFGDPQIWYVGRKVSGTPARCFGCLMPRKVEIGKLHFCLKKECIEHIKSSNNNIRPITLQS